MIGFASLPHAAALTYFAQGRGEDPGGAGGVLGVIGIALAVVLVAGGALYLVTRSFRARREKNRSAQAVEQPLPSEQGGRGRATADGRRPPLSGLGAVAQGATVTTVPSGTRSISQRMSASLARKQPRLAASPIDSGCGVACAARRSPPAHSWGTSG